MTITPSHALKNRFYISPTVLPRQGLQDSSAISALTDPSGQVAEDAKKLDKAARQLVGATFFGTLLKQMHQSPFKSEIFSGGRGEEAFSPLLNQHLVDRMSRGAGEKLVRSIVKRFHKLANETDLKPLPLSFDIRSSTKEPSHERTDRRA